MLVSLVANERIFNIASYILNEEYFNIKDNFIKAL